MSAHAYPLDDDALSALLPELQALRRELHRHPELAMEEQDTAARLKGYLTGHGLAPAVERLGGHGLLYRLAPEATGPVTLFRADMDALPIDEASGCFHCSVVPGRHHACGHDGHAAMLAGALAVLARHEDQLPGPLYALFQPAEETGEGMAACLHDPLFGEIPFERVYAMHVLPGAPLGEVVLPRGPAAAASTGLRIALTGQRSHASEPHLGANPIPVLAEAIPLIVAASSCLPYGQTGRATPVYLAAGSETYGMSPGDGVLGVTLRAECQEDLDAMLAHVARHLEARAGAAGLGISLAQIEPFPATVNDPEAVDDVEAAARAAGLAIRRPERPFPWSEDFGHATARWPGALVGLGAGEHQPVLHSAHFDFPDALLAPGIRLWLALASR